MEQRDFEQKAPALRKQMIAVAHRFGFDDDSAQDIAQDVMLRLWTLRNEIQSQTIEALAYVATRNCCISTLRKQKTVPLDSLAENALANNQTEHAIYDNENNKWLAERLQALPSTQFEVLRLRQVESRSAKEIAAILGITIDAVYASLSRARKTLYEQIKQRQR